MLLLDGVAGTAKAQPLDSLVLTPNGYVEMGDLKVNDLVIGKNGKSTKITGIYPQGVKEVYKVTFSDGSSARCCGDHLWFTQEYTERFNRKKIGGVQYTEPILGSVKSLNYIMDSVIYKGGSKDRLNHRIPQCDPVEFNEQSHVIHPYILGVLLGVGCMCQGNAYFTSADLDIVNKVEEFLHEDYEIGNHKANYSYSIKLKSHIGNPSNIYVNEIKRLNINKKSEYKSIPDEYLIDSIDNRLWLLKGLMDTDGTISKGRNTCSIHFGTSSSELSENVNFLINSFGGIVTVSITDTHYYNINGEKIKCLPQFLSYIKININPFELPRKSDLFQIRTKYQPTRWISDIVLDDIVECQCIMVDSEDHLYITNDFIVTHNTYISVYTAVELLKARKVDQIIYIRSVVESSSRSIGALPGELDDKFSPYSMPLVDKLNEILDKQTITALMEQNYIKAIPVNFVRGLTFNNSFVIIDESQNLTRSELTTILTRFGRNSKYIVCGDCNQSDIKDSGFKKVFELFDTDFSRKNDIHCDRFDVNDIVRSPILKHITQILGV